MVDAFVQPGLGRILVPPATYGQTVLIDVVDAVCSREDIVIFKNSSTADMFGRFVGVDLKDSYMIPVLVLSVVLTLENSADTAIF